VRSIAVDAKWIPLGTPVFLDTTLPDAGPPLQRLVVAQDTGGAIRGAPRADYFVGSGPQAADLAGKMRQQGSLWLLWPRNVPLPPPPQ
jgi:membrane-bound lytic murein transglycosylase A